MTQTKPNTGGKTVNVSKAGSKAASDKEPEWSVVSNDGRRTHFRAAGEHGEANARAYVAQHFPHVHVEPGTDYGDDGPQPDVFLRSPDGKLSGLVGGEWDEYSNE